MMPLSTRQAEAKARVRKANEVIVQLVELFPRCLFDWGYQRRPLKIGIFDDLLPLVPFAADDLKAALRRYTRADGYLRACVEGADRIDLEGNATGTVDAKHVAHAQKILAERELWRAKRNAAKQERQPKPKPAASDKRGRRAPQQQAANIGRKAELQPRETPAFARQSGSEAGPREIGAAANRTQPAQVDRDGFAALRVAAARRRESAGGA